MMSAMAHTSSTCAPNRLGLLSLRCARTLSRSGALSSMCVPPRPAVVKDRSNVTAIVLKAEKHIQQHDLVAALLERAGNFVPLEIETLRSGLRPPQRTAIFHWEYPLRFLIRPSTDGIV